MICALVQLNYKKNTLILLCFFVDVHYIPMYSAWSERTVVSLFNISIQELLGRQVCGSRTSYSSIVLRPCCICPFTSRERDGAVGALHVYVGLHMCVCIFAFGLFDRDKAGTPDPAQQDPSGMGSFITTHLNKNIPILLRHLFRFVKKKFFFSSYFSSLGLPWLKNSPCT